MIGRLRVDRRYGSIDIEFNGRKEKLKQIKNENDVIEVKELGLEYQDQLVRVQHGPISKSTAQ